ncbi:phospho-N-acetylmuramoyl-pentapeptide-transferase [Microbacterium sp. APC 3898]|uniref:Phospho-N-acetylmuramoyl-pentapeptide-transferase n=2 Tax=Planococcus TaxID=1372 RepID=A0ABT7ZH98_9BACL|nr:MULTISPECIES: phospho-N-acetylmuramoyl-pentapeptide-transferase [Terrabacteria group]MBF6633887.1 phospho-N-acetylmuramoyl-pentapeptide-transferase [Planococcus sp. (in: firmicutes)]MBD8013769.1 phospho-N-acetylmuramoyl-pentapeptide-transferase [Planococcus wigleyi]MDN3426072.1 phospho-N-acetylmuramoyl-pentapeptide-transferase [Planococcus sp. APC 4016]MDN3437666.1 phospho-N-acetylmuramoyl-pentapeptide-transferase [Planococcus sp. APC 3900]MDN3497769.1 phospho-N-acetylmuramoyl-pentapeptide-
MNAYTIMGLGLALILTVVLMPIFIPLLKRMKFGQSIREEGPESHMKKTGTPTMGGLVFLISIIITVLLVAWFAELLNAKVLILLLVLFGYGLIGFLDDFIKVVLKRNLGLTSLQKLIAQIVIAVISFLVLNGIDFETGVTIPFTDIALELSWFYVFFIVFWLVGFSNAVNLTDGLDGLVAGTASIAFAAFGLLAIYQDQIGIAIFTFSVTGGLLGFLIFNKYPAKVFMGDTGSLALGGALAMVSILLKQELLLLLIGLVFVIETASVILQVGSFKLRQKRIFKMSPIHHHFELSGWSEWKVVIVFWSVGLISAAIAVFLEVM